jgi:hypothetical protein
VLYLGFRRPGAAASGITRSRLRWMPTSPSGCLAAHRIGDECAYVAALGDVVGVAEAVHQLRPGARDASGVPAHLGSAKPTSPSNLGIRLGS